VGAFCFADSNCSNNFCVNVANICCSVRVIINKQANTHRDPKKTRVFQVVRCWSETAVNDGLTGEPGIGSSGVWDRRWGKTQLPTRRHKSTNVCHAFVREDSTTKWGKRQLRSRRQVQGAMTHPGAFGALGPSPPESDSLEPLVQLLELNLI